MCDFGTGHLGEGPHAVTAYQIRNKLRRATGSLAIRKLESAEYAREVLLMNETAEVVRDLIKETVGIVENSSVQTLN